MLKSSKATGLTSGMQDSFAVSERSANERQSGFRGGRASSPQGLVTRKSPPVAQARVVVGWRQSSVDQDVAFQSRQVVDVSGWSGVDRLGRAWRCCVFGEAWADALVRECRVVAGKVKVPPGFVVAMVEAFCAGQRSSGPPGRGLSTFSFAGWEGKKKGRRSASRNHPWSVEERESFRKWRDGKGKGRPR